MATKSARSRIVAIRVRASRRASPVRISSGRSNTSAISANVGSLATSVRRPEARASRIGRARPCRLSTTDTHALVSTTARTVGPHLGNYLANPLLQLLLRPLRRHAGAHLFDQGEHLILPSRVEFLGAFRRAD